MRRGHAGAHREIGLFADLHDASPSAKAAERRIGNVKDLITSLEGKRDVRDYLHLISLRSDDEDEGKEGEW